MNATIGDALILGIESVSEAIKTIAPEMWKAYYKQALINGWLGVTMSGVCLIVSCASIYKLIKCEDLGDEESITYWIMAILGTIIFLLLFCSFLPHILNPEYAAINNIMRSIGNIR